ncbi:MAG TPA: hypothetical protein VGB91_09370 [Rhizomicrobium sp.]
MSLVGPLFQMNDRRDRRDAMEGGNTRDHNLVVAAFAGCVAFWAALAGILFVTL